MNTQLCLMLLRVFHTLSAHYGEKNVYCKQDFMIAVYEMLRVALPKMGYTPLGETSLWWEGCEPGRPCVAHKSRGGVSPEHLADARRYADRFIELKGAFGISDEILAQSEEYYTEYLISESVVEYLAKKHCRLDDDDITRMLASAVTIHLSHEAKQNQEREKKEEE